MTALRVLALLLLGACVLAVGAWITADHYATDWVDDQLKTLHLDRVVSVGAVHLPAPDLVRLTDVALFDETSGTEVARVDELELRLVLPGPGGWKSVKPALLSGRGGTALFTADGDTLVFARAIDTMLDHIFAALEPSAAGPGAPPPAPADPGSGEAVTLPPMEFRDIELTLRLPGQPDRVLPGAAAFLENTADSFLVDVDAGREGGHVTLRFDNDGLRRLTTRDVPVTPVCALFMPLERDIVVDDVRPEGRLDFNLEFDKDWNARGTGVLREATLRPPLSPFPLTQVTVPFEFDGESFRVREALASFEGGSLTASIDSGAHELSWSADVLNADFRRDYLDLLPDDLDLSWVDPADGGNLELHLRVVEAQPSDAAGPVPRAQISAWGGFLVQALRVGPTHVLVEDMVGRFEFRDDVLTVLQASGRCSSGVVALRGSINIESGDVDAGGTIYDVDIERIRHSLDPEAAAAEGPRSVSGWMQGDITYKGRVSDPGLATGKGHFSVRGGNLWRVPVLDAILDTLHLSNPGATERHRLTVSFDIKGRRYDISVLKLESPFLSLVGDGRVDRDGAIDINIVPIKVPLGYVGDLIDYLQAQVVQLQLRGTLADPKVSLVPVKMVTQNVGAAWDWLGGKFSSEPEPAGPPFPPLEPAAGDAPPAPATAPPAPPQDSTPAGPP